MARPEDLQGTEEEEMRGGSRGRFGCATKSFQQGKFPGSRKKTACKVLPHGVDKSRHKLLYNLIVVCGYKMYAP